VNARWRSFVGAKNGIVDKHGCSQLVKQIYLGESKDAAVTTTPALLDAVPCLTLMERIQVAAFILV
jgi:hypothetical protein